jgi:hypothetical protein
MNKISNDWLLVISVLAMLVATWFLTVKKRLDALRASNTIPFTRKRTKKWRMNNSLSLPVGHAGSFWRTEFYCRDFLYQLRVIPHNTVICVTEDSSSTGGNSPGGAADGVDSPRANRSKSISHAHALALKELSNIPGCEPDGPNVKHLRSTFPDISVSDAVRFLVARKGDLTAATEMLEKSIAWRKANLPVPRSVAEPVLATGCCFFHHHARDGTPVIYFRGGLYDNTKCSFQTYVLVAAQTIDHLMSNSKALSVTVVVHLGTVVGGPNAGADMNFIKYFVQVSNTYILWFVC